VLIIVPSSESKRPPLASGRPVALEELSFPALLPTRRRVAEALVETSSDLDAFARLRVGLTLAHEVARNTRLFELPAMPVLDLYTGPVHEGLAASSLSTNAGARAGECLVVVSALWGALRPADHVPPYRLALWAGLIGIDRLDAAWRAVLPSVLAEAAGGAGVVVDIRSPGYQSFGMPAGLGDRTVSIRITQGPPGQRVGEVITKRLRGAVARYLLESGADPADPHALADVLAERWPVRLEAPERPGKPWSMTLSIDWRQPGRPPPMRCSQGPYSGRSRARWRANS
jgi:cytoplasmic iron level regulating protein YaaA (DUF328/UPF0246 family)